MDFGGVKGFDCPSNQNYTCSPDGTTATFSWDAVNNASGYNLRIDRNASSWFGSEDTSDVGTSLRRVFSVQPDVKNSFSVQAVGPNEEYPYTGSMCWQEFTCKNTLPPNNPPICSATPIVLSPNQTNFLPDSEVSITAQGFTDADNDPLTITNWQVTAGTIISKSADSKNIVLKMPNTNNGTVAVSYVVSDGKSNSTCVSPITLKTKIAYACTNDQCVMDANGNYGTNADCSANCISKKYACTTNGQCIYDPLNGTYPTSNCDNACAPATVTCDKINVSGSLTQGSQVLLSANIKNFPIGGAQSTYQWVSQYGTVDISGDPNCNQTTKICNMQLNKAYTTAQIKYNVPLIDTLHFKVNGNVVSSCTLNVNDTAGKDISLQFVDPSSFSNKSTYNISVGSNDNTVLIQTIPKNYFSNYFLKLSCLDKSKNAPCAPGSYRFKNTSELDKTTKFLSSLTSNVPYREFVYLNFANPTTVTLNIEGNVIPLAPSLTRFSTAEVNITKPSVFTMSVVYSGDGVYKTNNSDYCTTTYTSSFSEAEALFENVDTNISESYDFANLLVKPLPTKLSGNYNLSLSLKPTVSKKEIKCIKVTKGAVSNINTSTSANFDADGSDINVYVVVGPTEGNTWYEAFGGSAYSKGIIKSNIEETTSSVLNTIGNIWAGVLQSSGLEINNGAVPSKYVVHPPKSPLLNLKDISDLQLELENSSLSKITNLNSVSKTLDTTKFYYYSTASNVLNINSDFKIDSGKKVPVVFVKGDINISNTVKQVDIILIATGTINVGTSLNTLNDLIINGSLLARKNVIFKSLKLVPDVNGKLTEKIYFKPSVYFSNTLDSLYFKNINIYTNLID